MRSFITTTLPLLLATSTAVLGKKIAEFNVYNSGGCNNYIQQYDLYDYTQEPEDGACHQLDSTANNEAIFSIEPVYFFSDSCSVTVYTDPYCSDNAQGAAKFQCVSFNQAFQSYAVDCGSPGSPWCVEEAECE